MQVELRLGSGRELSSAEPKTGSQAVGSLCFSSFPQIFDPFTSYVCCVKNKQIWLPLVRSVTYTESATLIYFDYTK